MTTPEFIASLKNPRYNSSSSKQILFDCIYNGKPTTFLAGPKDIQQYGRDIFAAAISGKYGPIAPYVSQPSKEMNNIKTITVTDMITDLVKRIDKLEKEVEILKGSK